MNRHAMLVVLGTLLLPLSCGNNDPIIEPNAHLVLQPSDRCADHGATAVATFEDVNLETAIRAALSVGPQEEVTCGLISGLTYLYAVQAGVRSLVGIQNLAGLTTLHLAVNPIGDISALSELTSLTLLSIFNTHIIDVGPLKGLTNLTSLDIGLNPDLRDIRPLVENPGLTTGDTVNVVLTAVSCTDIAALSAQGVTVIMDPPALSPSYLVGGYPSTPYADTIAPAAGCHGDYRYRVTDGALPYGLSLDSGNGTITGTPTTPGMSYFEVTATSPDAVEPPVRFDRLSASAVYTITVSNNPPEGFNMWGVGAQSTHPIPREDVRKQIDAVLARWEEIVTSDLPDVTVSGGASEACAVSYWMDLDGAFIDDVVMLIAIRGMDGREPTLGGARPCWLSESAPFTIMGSVVLDFYEVVFEQSVTGDDLYTLIWHEFGHAMGIVNEYWKRFSYLEDEEGPDPRYVGSGAVLEYGSLLGSATSSVEVEDQGGVGSRNTHWRETVFLTEMMTPRLNRGERNPISRMTIRALEDVGWSADVSQADPYALPDCAGSCPRAPARPISGERTPVYWEVPLDLPTGTQAREP